MFFLIFLDSTRFICRLTALAAILLAVAAQAQVVPSAIEPHHGLWLGGEFSNIHAGFPYESNQRLWGLGAFADYHITSHLDVQAEMRFLRFNSFYGEKEDNYLAGPRYVVGRFGKPRWHWQDSISVSDWLRELSRSGSGSGRRLPNCPQMVFNCGIRISVLAQFSRCRRRACTPDHSIWLSCGGCFQIAQMTQRIVFISCV